MTTPVLSTLEHVLDSFMDKLFKGVQKTIESARLATLSTVDTFFEKGSSMQIEAGRQVKLAIENCKNAYADSLDITIDQLSPEIQKTLGTVQQLVEDLLNPKVEALSDVAMRVEQLIRSLPWVKDHPYIIRSTPNFIAYSEVESLILIRFIGRVNNVKLSDVTFSIQNQTFSPIGNVQPLTFKVPSKHFSPLDPLVEGKLRFTWIKEGWAFNSKVTNVYKIWIGVLPSIPGTLAIEYSQHFTKPEVKKLTSGEYLQHSGKAGGGLTIRNKQYAVSPEEGWKIVRGSHRFIIIETRPKNTNWSFVRDDQGQVVYEVTTVHDKEKKKSGKVRFKIEFDQCKETPVAQALREDVPVKWGESKVIDNQKGTFQKVVFRAFDGVRYEMAGVSSSNPYLKIKNEGGKLVLQTVTPETLSFSSLPLNSKL